MTRFDRSRNEPRAVCCAQRWIIALTFVVASVACACGYTPIMIEREPAHRFCVVAEAPAVADANASIALAAGVRLVLSRAGALGNSCPTARTLGVSLQSLSSTPEGIASFEGQPESRGMRVVAVGRAHLGDGQQAWQAQGEVNIGVSADTQTHAQWQTDARALAAARAGERLGYQVLGQPSPGTVSGP